MDLYVSQSEQLLSLNQILSKTQNRQHLSPQYKNYPSDRCHTSYITHLRQVIYQGIQRSLLLWLPWVSMATELPLPLIFPIIWPFWYLKVGLLVIIRCNSYLVSYLLFTYNHFSKLNVKIGHPRQLRLLCGFKPARWSNPPSHLDRYEGAERPPPSIRESQKTITYPLGSATECVLKQIKNK